MSRTTLAIIVLFISSNLSAQEASEQFRRLDRNRDGKLKNEEFSAPLFDQIDPNQDGVITAEEDQRFVRRRLGGAGPQGGTLAVPESKLVGGAIQEHRDQARHASPTTYVTTDDSPFLLIHGTHDPLVPFQQSELLAATLKKVRVEALLVPVTGGGHGNFGTP